MIASQFGFNILLLLFTIGAAGSLLCYKKDALANGWSTAFAVAGSLWGLLFSVALLLKNITVSSGFTVSWLPLVSFSLNIDKLAAFFIGVICLIALFASIYGAGYVKHFYGKYNLGALGFFYHIFIAGMILVVTASNALFFLIVWEIMSLASYFLVVYDRKDSNNIKAGFVYLVMTHAGTAFIIVAFLLIYKFTGSFDFAEARASAGLIPAAVKNTVFFLALIGFGTKAGIIPFHIWLPGAHPAAPSHVSALMSGVMIKTGIYMMIRLFLDILQPVPAWWGLVILIIGSVSALLGVLYALTEHDIKRLLAYHSIENIGIILLGVGSALTFASLGTPSLALLGIAAALFHTLNHAAFKSLLFLSAGSVINQTHTRNIEEYGGLIKRMPQTAFFFLIGSMAISALPPFNGFFSEWLTFQSLFQGITALGSLSRWIFIAAAAALALTGGLALACFVKAFGAAFLARPRSEEAVHAKESSFTLRAGMAGLAILCLLFGVFSGRLIMLFTNIGQSLAAFQSGAAPTARQSFAAISAPIILLLLITAVLIVFLLTRLVSRRQKIHIGSTWDCGTDLTPRMEISATGFARSIIVIFKGILKPNLQHKIEYRDADSIYQSYFYQPLRTLITKLSLRAKRIQSGNINAYILYITLALAAALWSAL